MKTNEQLEAYFNDALNTEREKIIGDFIALCKDKESGKNLSWKITHFQNRLIDQITEIFRVKKGEQLFDDRYYKDLTSRFHYDRFNYENDVFFVKFLDVEVPEIKETVTKNNFPAKLEIFNAGKEKTLEYIAKFYAIRGLLDDYPKNSSQFDNENDFVKVWRKEGELLGGEPKENSGIGIKNNFNTLDISVVHKFFFENLVQKNYLTEVEYKSYLKAAFETMTPPPNRFSLKNVSTKAKIIGIFYDFYKEVAQKPHGKQKKYAALLGDYFSGYTTSSVSTNFTK